MMTNQVEASGQPHRPIMWRSAAVRAPISGARSWRTSAREVKRLETAEASSLGAAIAAAKGAGWFRSTVPRRRRHGGKAVKTFRPRAKACRRYQELLAIYTDLYPVIRDWNARSMPLPRRAAHDRLEQLISDVVAGKWKDPTTNKAATVPFEMIRIEESLDGGEADMIAPLKLGKRIAVVSDVNTNEAMGRRVAKHLKALGTIEELVLPGNTHCDEPTIAMVQEKTRHADAIVAVGSGALSDTCKYATFKDGRKYATFGTAASMNGYAASTASVTLNNGYKTSLPAHAPRGIFLDLKVTADAPHWLSAAGLGDSLCRPTAQVEWWASHRLFGTFYSSVPYTLFADDEPKMIESAAGLAKHDIAANGHLHRVLTLCGLGVCFTGVSHHGSMGEHQVSHWIDMFAGDAHPGTTHGQQVGVASLAIARLHHELLSLDHRP
jgi:glycerol-1-phosphate dehydrogenase [NAD(P)+]